MAELGAASERFSNGVGTVSDRKKRSGFPGFLRKSSSPAAKHGRSAGAGAVVREASSGDGQTQTAVLTTKTEKLQAEEKGRQPCARSKKWSSFLGLRKPSSSGAGGGRGGKKKAANSGAGENRKLGACIENRDWDGVRDILRWGKKSASTKEQPPDDQDKHELPVKCDENLQRQEVIAILDTIVDFSGQNALHHMCRFRPPVDVISHVIDIRCELPLGLDCLERMPLHIAAAWGAHPEVIVKLLESSLSHLASKEGEGDGEAKRLKRVTGKPDTHGRTPLHFAAEYLSMQVSRTYGMYGPAFATATVDSKGAENSLLVLKILADACPSAVDLKDDNGLTPSDYVLRGGGFGCRSRRGGVNEDDVRRKAVRFLVRARGRKARLRNASGSRRKHQSGQQVDRAVSDASSSSSDSSILPKREMNQLHIPKGLDPEVKSAAQEEDERRGDDMLAARLLELMGCSPEDKKALDRDEASMERMRQIISASRKNQSTSMKCGGSAMPPVVEVEVPQRGEIEDDGISVLTPPGNVPGWKDEKSKFGNQACGENCGNTIAKDSHLSS